MRRRKKPTSLEPSKLADQTKFGPSFDILEKFTVGMVGPLGLSLGSDCVCSSATHTQDRRIVQQNTHEFMTMEKTLYPVEIK